MKLYFGGVLISSVLTLPETERKPSLKSLKELKEILQADCSPNTEVTPCSHCSQGKSFASTPQLTFSSSDVRVGKYRVLKEEKKKKKNDEFEKMN